MESTILQSRLLKSVATALVAGLEVVGIGLLVLTAMSCSNATAEEKKLGLGTYQWESGTLKINCEDKVSEACLKAAEALKNAEKYRRIIREYEDTKKEMNELLPRNIRGLASRI